MKKKINLFHLKINIVRNKYFVRWQEEKNMKFKIEIPQLISRNGTCLCLIGTLCKVFHVFVMTLHRWRSLLCVAMKSKIFLVKKTLPLKTFLVAFKIIVGWVFEMVGFRKYVSSVKIIEIDFFMQNK